MMPLAAEMQKVQQLAYCSVKLMSNSISYGKDLFIVSLSQKLLPLQRKHYCS